MWKFGSGSAEALIDERKERCKREQYQFNLHSNGQKCSINDVKSAKEVFTIQLL